MSGFGGGLALYSGSYGGLGGWKQEKRNEQKVEFALIWV